MKKWSLIILVILVTSCGTRKVEMQLQKARTEELREIVLKLQNDIQTNVRITKVGSSKIIESIVPDKESTYNGKTFKNTKITIIETQSDSTAIINDNSKKEITDTQEKETVTKNKTKDTKSKKPNPWLWIALLGLFLAAAWWLDKRLN